VSVVTAIGTEGQPVGVTANSIASVSLQPPLLLWCLANKSSSLGAFKLDAEFAVHILAEHQADIALHFARAGSTKFPTYEHSAPGLPIVEEALARIVCRVTALYAAGDHTIIVGQVNAVESRSAAPLVFQSSRFGRFAPAQDEPWSLFVDMWS